MKKWMSIGFLAALALPAYAQKREKEQIENAGRVMQEILNTPDSIPQSLLDKAACVVVLPSVLRAAFVVGGTYWRGVMTCRGGKDFQGKWGAPTMMSLEGGSFGLQIGGQATDFVLLVMNSRLAPRVLSGKVKLGGDASAAAGPVGRTAYGETEVAMRSEILSYSRARGTFAGVSLDGSTLRPDNDANKNLYGKEIEAKEIVLGGAVKAPPSASTLISALDKASLGNTSTQHPPPPPPPPPERNKLDALYWNTWIEHRDDDLQHEAVTTLRTQQDYDLVLDLSALSYQAQNGLYSTQLAGSLMKLIADPQTKQLDVDVYLLYDQRYFAPLSAKEAYQTRSLSITKIRAVEADKNLTIPEHLSLKDSFRPELSAFRFITLLKFPLKTNRKEGSTSLGLSVWYRGVPVQEILLPPTCISDSQPENCDAKGVPTASFSGLDSALLIGVDRAAQPTPTFALHLIDLQGQGTKAVFKCNACPSESAFFSWTIASSLPALGEQLKGSILLNVDAISKVTDPTWLRTAGRSILHLLFYGDNPTDSNSAIKMLSDTVKNSDVKNPPVLFVRAIAAGQDPLFLLPIGMAAVDTSNGGVEYLGFHFRIETPLLNASYKTAACVDKWRILVPPEGKADIPLKRARQAMQTGLRWLGNLPECSGKTADSNCEFSDIGRFSDWISSDDPIQPNLALVLLGHHDNNRIYWDVTGKDAIPASLFVAKFQQPSIVVFNACGTAKPGETAMLKNLNQIGDVSTIIATFSEVPGAMAGTFTSILIDNLRSHQPAARYSLAQAVFDTTLKLRDEVVPAELGAPKDTKYGAFALLFGLVGNGGVSVCIQ